ncbi:glycoside hydrolase family 43 protein [Gracilibacillus caseinilyticus]|uniref:Glycoside hydrolase family 43 protein n=1 Tax=Gracilibacillus caseinilyticus TaxID=2932256 RepID=A0ABY4F431_9BACI|nr:glycoside hydrolase family 43 protein [Gracilibacillus caseinilyticus]UOQ50669.1 glycoside hydrolase family 43 protein [Gracilibacillus caseinilyticus]
MLLSLLFIGISGVSVSAAFWDMEEHPMIHDPSMVKENDTYWIFGTGPADGNGIKVIYSNDNGYSWGEAPVIFPQPASWWSNYVPNHASNQWAPDIEYFNGRYWLYYSVSSFGSNQSLIGLLSTESISSGNWRDDGLVTRSTTSDNYNAIDPAMIVDENGQPWLSYGSYWSGIKLTKLDPSTMKPTGTQYSIAARPSDPEHAVEAPTITYHNGYYYLFVSFDSCCNGVNSDYKIAVGRSTQITGPYYDKLGNSMMQGGGTIIDTGNDKWIGPGHQDVYQNLLIRHAYDADSNGLPRLLINDLNWDSNGWPTY